MRKRGRTGDENTSRKAEGRERGGVTGWGGTGPEDRQQGRRRLGG